MIDNEAIQEELEAEQETSEVSVLEGALLAALLLTLTELYAEYDTGDSLNMSKGKRKKKLFSRITGILAEHYLGVSSLVEGNAKEAFESAYEKFMTAYEEELDLPIVEIISAEVIRAAFDRGYPLKKTMTHNRNLTARLIRRQLQESFRQYEPLQQLTARVTAVVQSDTNRIETVVQEETARMQNEAQIHSIETAESQGIGVEVIWNSMRDGKVRQSHRELHGKKADAEGYFYAGDCKGKHPHGFEGPNSIKQNIRCRCYLEIKGVNVADSEIARELNSAASSSARREVWEKRRALAKERARGDIS